MSHPGKHLRIINNHKMAVLQIQPTRRIKASLCDPLKRFTRHRLISKLPHAPPFLYNVVIFHFASFSWINKSQGSSQPLYFFCNFFKAFIASSIENRIWGSLPASSFIFASAAVRLTFLALTNHCEKRRKPVGPTLS